MGELCAEELVGLADLAGGGDPEQGHLPGAGRRPEWREGVARSVGESDRGGQNSGCKVLTELRHRGVGDIIIACVDGLTGFPEAIETAFPHTQVQLCIVPQVRNALSYVSYKDRKAVAADLKKIYQSAPLEEAEQQLTSLGQTWNERYPTIHRSWDQLTAFFAYPPKIRKVIYTTNAIESLHRSMRKILKARRACPNDEAATKPMYLALQNIAKRWTWPVKDWKKALNQFAIMYEDRVPLP